MRRAFSGGGGAIVTTGTGTRYPGMIKVHRGPTCIDVTIVTGVRTLDMRRTFPGGGGAVMTSKTTSGGSGMVEPGIGPS